MQKLELDFNIHFATLRKFIRKSDIAPTEKALLVNLLLYGGVNGEIYPSELQLGKDFGLSDRHIRTLLNNLKQKGWITNWKQRGFSKSNKYIINQELYFHIDNKNRKSTSVQSGTPIPIKIGTPIPPKVSQESNQLSSSQILQLFEKTSKKTPSPSDNKRLGILCNVYTEDWVRDSIIEASKRNLPYLEVGFIKEILEDWKLDGKPQPKLQFIPCRNNGCENGYIQNSTNIYRICQCRINYEKVTK